MQTTLSHPTNAKMRDRLSGIWKRFFQEGQLIMKNHFVLIYGCYAKGNKLLAFEMLYDVVIDEEKWNRLMILIA